MSLSDRLDDARDQRVSFSVPSAPTVEPTAGQSDGLAALESRAIDVLFQRIGNRVNDSSLTEDQLRGFVREELGRIIEEERLQLTSDEKSRVIREIEDDALGLGPLQRLLDDTDVTEIMVNGHRNIYVERGGKLTLSGLHFASDALDHATH